METRLSTGRSEYQRMTTDELRDAFLIEGLFAPGELKLVYWETDRAIVGSAVPGASPIQLQAGPELAADFFCQRRELGVINLGGTGRVTVDGEVHDLERLAILYVGRGSREISFASAEAARPAKFFLMSYPAHAIHPVQLCQPEDAHRVELGERETANERTIFQGIHEGGLRSCQLVMGFTQLKLGSVWNTMPPHTHVRRSEVYLYFDVANEAAVVHLMGPGDETRHLLVQDGQAVLSPIWSIHAGCGTRNYSFVWAMGGENQRFDDMDGIAIRDLR